MDHMVSNGKLYFDQVIIVPASNLYFPGATVSLLGSLGSLHGSHFPGATVILDGSVFHPDKNKILNAD